MEQTLQTRPADQTDGMRCALTPAGHCHGGREFTAIAVADFAADELAEFVAAPEQVFNVASATLVKQGRSARVIRANLSIGGLATQVAYKRCGSRSWHRRLVRALRPSVAVRNFRLGHNFLKLGIDTPRPLIAVSPRWRNLFRPSYLATEWIDGALPLDAFARSVNTWAPNRRRAALRDGARNLGRLIATLHRQRYSHRDLKSANLLAREKNGDVEVFLIDLDGASRSRLRVATTRIKNLSRLQEATVHMIGVTQTLRCRFLQSYLLNLSGSQDWKTVWRQLAKNSKIPPPCRAG